MYVQSAPPPPHLQMPTGASAKCYSNIGLGCGNADFTERNLPEAPVMSGVCEEGQGGDRLVNKTKTVLFPQRYGKHFPETAQNRDVKDAKETGLSLVLCPLLRARKIS